MVAQALTLSAKTTPTEPYLGFGRNVALYYHSLHPLLSGFAKRLGASISEMTIIATGPEPYHGQPASEYHWFVAA
jgi:hypothetical protein